MKYQIDFETPTHQIGRVPKQGGSNGVSDIFGSADWGRQTLLRGSPPIVGRSAPGTPTQSLVFAIPQTNDPSREFAHQDMYLDLGDGGRRYSISFRLRVDKLSAELDADADEFRVMLGSDAWLDFEALGTNRGGVWLGGRRTSPSGRIASFRPGDVMRWALQIDVLAKRMRVMQNGETVGFVSMDPTGGDLQRVGFHLLDHDIMGDTRVRLDEVNVRVNPEPGTALLAAPLLCLTSRRRH